MGAMTISTPTPTRAAVDPAAPRAGRVLRIARWSMRRPIVTLLLWLAFVAASIVGGQAVGSNQLTAAESGVGESGQAGQIVEDAGYPVIPTEQVLIRSRSGKLDPKAAAKVAESLKTQLTGLPEVAEVGDLLPSENGQAAMVPVVISVSGKNGPEASTLAEERVTKIQSVTSGIARANPDLRIEQVGDSSLGKAVNDQVDEDFKQAEFLSLPITLIILLLSFGALIAAAVPVLLALSAVGTAIGLSALISQLLPVTDAMASVILLIGMAVGVDYSLFAIRRAREERLRGAERKSAIDIAAQTSGRAVVVSGLAVLVSMSGLLLSGNSTFKSMAIGTMVVVAVAMLGSLTVLPAVLSLLGDWVDRPRIPLIHRLTSRRANRSGGAWPAVLRVVVGRPVVFFGLAMVALLALAAPALNLRTGEAGADSLPRSIPQVVSYDALTDAFPQEGFVHQIVLWSDSPLDKKSAQAGSQQVIEKATATGLFSDLTQAKPEFSPNGKTMLLDLPVPGDFNSDDASRSLDFTRKELNPVLASAVPQAEIGVTGPTANAEDFGTVMKQRLPWVMGFVLTITFIILVLAFRSIVIAGTAVLLNLVSVGAAYGILTLVFQEGVGSGLLNTPKTGFIVDWLPLFLFVVLFGLSMDYHVFVVSRIREAYLAGASTKDAIISGVSTSAGVVTSAALVMVGVFSIFATLSLVDVKQLGVGLAAAILLDATLVRAVLLPAAMALLGQANWWMPERLGRRLPDWSH